MLTTLITIAAWVVLAAIVFVTLSPIHLRPHLGASPVYERIGAFVVLGLLAGWAYAEYWPILAGALAIAIAALEAAQNLVPGRHGTVPDALQKLAGAALGVAAALFYHQAPH